MNHTEKNTPLTQAEQWENANIFQKIAMFFGEGFWEDFKEGWAEVPEPVQAVVDEDDFDEEDDFDGVPDPFDTFDMTHSLYYHCHND